MIRETDENHHGMANHYTIYFSTLIFIIIFSFIYYPKFQKAQGAERFLLAIFKSKPKVRKLVIG